MDDSVECHSEFEYAERPLAFLWEGQRMEVDEILASWRTPEARCFRVRTLDNQLFDLLYQEADDRWQIEQC